MATTKKNQTVQDLKKNEGDKKPTVKSKSKTDRLPDRDHANKGRPAREKFKRGGQLDAEQRSGYRRIWEIDIPGNIETRERRWWIKVLDAQGRPRTVPGGAGRTHYLMEIQENFYQEDIAEMHRENDMYTKDILSVKKFEGEYLPKGHEETLEVDKGYYREMKRLAQQQEQSEE